MNECRSLCQCSPLQILPPVRGLATLEGPASATLAIAKNTAARPERKAGGILGLLQTEPRKFSARDMTNLSPLVECVKPAPRRFFGRDTPQRIGSPRGVPPSPRRLTLECRVALGGGEACVCALISTSGRTRCNSRLGLRTFLLSLRTSPRAWVQFIRANEEPDNRYEPAISRQLWKEID